MSPKVDERDRAPNFLTTPYPRPGAHPASPTACPLWRPHVAPSEPDSCGSPSGCSQPRRRSAPRALPPRRAPPRPPPACATPAPCLSLYQRASAPGRLTCAPPLPPEPVAPRPRRGVPRPVGLPPALPSSRKLPREPQAQESCKDLPDGRSRRLVRPALRGPRRPRALCPGPPRRPCLGEGGVSAVAPESQRPL